MAYMKLQVRASEMNELSSADGNEENFLCRMDAIARGLEARINFLLQYHQVITKETVDVARRLGITEEEIKLWEEKRAQECIQLETLPPHL